MTLATYQASDFATPAKDCDIIMKGGVTSGLVYPYAILEMARVYRFRSIGGTSAGAIAAAFAAAAEYARSIRNDPDGFLRMQAHCEALPALLAGLFQPAPQFRTLLAFLLRAQADTRPLAILVALVTLFWPIVSIGAALGGALAVLLQGGVLAAILAGLIGTGVALVLFLRATARDLVRHNFGICPGLTQPGAGQPALTDWMHQAIQDIAFGPAGRPEPLTFGDLESPGPDGKTIELRMMTTNLSMRRPHTLPNLRLRAFFDLAAWRAFFPSDVIGHLARVATAPKHHPALRDFPEAPDLPVVVAARMSLSFPLLFCAVPMSARDIASSVLARHTGGDGTVRLRRLWFIDGGVSSNFPIHMFDALLPSRPTFALSLDALPPGAQASGNRVKFSTSAGDGVNLPVHDVDGLVAFAGGILDAAKDWQDNMLSGMPGQRERIARVMLSDAEGGLNLTMPPERSEALMRYGREVGLGFANGALDFDEHRWRRALITYEQLERTVHATAQTWSDKGFGTWLKAYMTVSRSYGRVGKTDRANIRARLNGFAGLARLFTPPMVGKERKLPRPPGRLKIGPDL
jgi:predicted acylesterase/phospholipase RssA